MGLAEGSLRLGAERCRAAAVFVGGAGRVVQVTRTCNLGILKAVSPRTNLSEQDSAREMRAGSSAATVAVSYPPAAISDS